MTLKLLTTAVAILMTATTEVACQKSDVNNLRKLLEDHFSTNRHHVTNPAGKTAAAKFVSDTFRSYGLITWEWNFQGENKYTGTNIFAMWPGRNTGTGLDRPICLTADLDTDKNRPGRDDNGSGMAAVLEAARLITSETCIQDNTIFFAIFDFAHRSGGKDGACAEGSCGSKEFNNYVIQPYIEHQKIDPTQWSGVITLDCILNYNSSAMSQEIPGEELFKVTPGLKSFYDGIKANGQRGDFMSVLYRTNSDSSLHSKFDKQWAAEGNPQYRMLSADIPYKNVTDIIDAKEGPYWQIYEELVNHDIYSFWEENEDIPAILVSDTGDTRGREKPWSECRPEDNMELTPDRLQFLKKTTDVVTEVIRDMSGTRQQCRGLCSYSSSLKNYTRALLLFPIPTCVCVCARCVCVFYAGSTGKFNEALHLTLLSGTNAKRLSKLDDELQYTTNLEKEKSVFLNPFICSVDPAPEAPSGFNSGLSLSGELTLGPADTKTFTLKVSSFTSSGLVTATLSNSSWTLDFEGRYDGDTHLLMLRPKPVVDDITFKPLVCGMTGNLEELSDGVLYSGRLEGGCGLTAEENAYVTFVLYSGGLCYFLDIKTRPMYMDS
ncbi:uncharacterized protein LOC118407159 [Branchiostoma floridae]|uniref:Uncharacterized protein LOC118407159 n=1 Tax=Branchiostoma floridae TaxID=7739 RepID=A0A9J7HS57_BRAFL|nr:uncharacterized protein LOC118407159 [Branchiostoma floridae]